MKGKKITVLIGSYHSIQVFRKDNYIAWNLRQFKPRTPGVKVGWYKTLHHFWWYPAFILSKSYKLSPKQKKSTKRLSENHPFWHILTTWLIPNSPRESRIDSVMCYRHLKGDKGRNVWIPTQTCTLNLSRVICIASNWKMAEGKHWFSELHPSTRM